MSKYVLLEIKIEKDENAYMASCPALPGCITYGKTYSEAYKNIQEAVECHIEAFQKLHKSKYALFLKKRYVEELHHPSVVALIKDAS